MLQLPLRKMVTRWFLAPPIILLISSLLPANMTMGEPARSDPTGPAKLGFPAVLASTEDSTISVTITAGPYRVTSTAQGQKVAMQDFGYLLVPGKPALPSKIFALAIPPGAELSDLTFETGEGIVLAGEYDIVPAPLPRVIGQEDPLVHAEREQQYRADFDTVYGSDDAYPPSIVEFVRTAGYRKYNLIDVRFTPFAYRPISGQLTHYPEVTIRVSYRPSEKAPQPPADNVAGTERIAREIVVNYDQSQQWYARGSSPNKGLHDFVIITLDSLTSSVTSLVDWETTKGRNVEVVTTSWINSNYTGYDLAERMRNFLRDKYPSEEWGIEDVLLIGHYDDVPMRRTAQNVGYGQPETDLYYAELSLPDGQSWDADGDHQYGEASDPIDFYSEVNVGRIPWSDSATVQSICQKSAAYEQNEDPTFKNNMLLLGAYFWPNTDNAVLMEAKVDQPWMAGWTLTRMYEKNSDYWSSYDCDYPLLHSNVMSVWSTGTYAFVNWAGHGSPTSCHIYGLGAPPFISSFDCPSLNDDYPAIVFADACSNSDTDYLNIGQAMLKQGAVGFLGATKVAYGCSGWNNPYDGSSQSLDYFFTTYVTSGEYTQGQAHQAALREMYTNGLWDDTRYEMFEWGALWGNPDLRIGPPPILSIAFPDGLPEYLEPGVDTPFSVRIIDGTESYVPGTGMLHYRYDDGTFLTNPLTHVSGDLYEATLPATGYDSTPEFYFSAQGDGGTTILSPLDAPNTVYTALVGTFTIIMAESLDTSPGWSTEGLWAFGQPTGAGGEYGGPDPASGHTGENVYGYNLNGDYANNMPEYHLTSTAMNCAGISAVTLKFWRWLGVEQSAYDHAYVRVSNDGTTWTTIWQNGGEVADSSWILCEYDISSVADGQPTVYLRWTMGTTDVGWRYCGWNIDDVEIWGLLPNMDCNHNGIPDHEDIGNGSSEDCNNNHVPDECEIDENSSAPGGPFFCTDDCDPDCNDNGIPDECDIALGTSPDVNRNGIPDECEVSPPAPAPAPHNCRKNRYISVAPNNGLFSVALQVEMTASAYFRDSTGVVGWVGEPSEDHVARVVDVPHYSDAWPDVVHLGDCEIIPVATYGVRATGNGVIFSDPLEVATITAPTDKWWGDVVGASVERGWTEPDGLVNMDDIMAAVQRFQQLPGAPPMTWVDVDGESPNLVVNFTDIMRIIQGFMAEPYPFSDPANCP